MAPMEKAGRIFGVFALFFALACGGCGSRAVRFEPEPSGKSKPAAVIFVPGFYGSALADAETGERFFLSAWAALFGRTPLALAEPDLGVAGARKLVPDGVLESIRVVPGIYGYDVYGVALDFLRDVAGNRAEVVPFDYDWRGDLHDSVKRLDGVVRRLREGGTTRIVVVAHSMGGLVASYYARYGAEAPETAEDRPGFVPPVDAVALVGVPFHGAMTAFRNLQTGTSLGPAKTPLAQASLATFPAMYHLVPRGLPGVYVEGAFRPLAESMHRYERWEKDGLGLLRPPLPDDGALRARRASAQAKYLDRADRFLGKLQAEAKGRKALPAVVVVGTGLPTFARAVFADGRWFFSEETLGRQLAAEPSRFFEDGDGTVTARSARPPSGLAERLGLRTVETRAAHEEMFGDDSVRETLARFFAEALSTRR